MFFLFRPGFTISKDYRSKTLEEMEKMKVVPIGSTIGNLMYALLGTRPDIYFAVGMVSRYESNPGNDHWTVIKCVYSSASRVLEIICWFTK